MHRAISSDPESIWLSHMYSYLAWSYLNIGDFVKGKWYFKMALNLSTNSKDSIEALNGLTHASQMLDETELALNYAETWLTVDPYAVRYLGEIYCYQLDRCEEGEKYYQQILEIAPDRFNFRHRLGVAKWINGKKEEGRQLIEQEAIHHPTPRRRWWQ